MNCCNEMSGQDPILKWRQLGPCVESLVWLRLHCNKVDLVLPLCSPLSGVLSLKQGCGPRVGGQGQAFTMIAGQGVRDRQMSRSKSGGGAPSWRAVTGALWEGALANTEF